MESLHQQDFYIDLFENVLTDAPHIRRDSEFYRHLERDLKTLRSRTANEGLSFLTSELPKLGKEFDRCLAGDRIQFSCPAGFSTAAGRATPEFLGGLFELVFDRSGFVLDQCNHYAVAHLRQVLFLAYKLEIPHSKSQERAVFQRVLENEEILARQDLSVKNQILLEAAAKLIWHIFKDLDPFDIVPRHGPGAVATGERDEEKWLFKRSYTELSNLYPIDKFFCVNGIDEVISDRWDWYTSLELAEEPTSKIVLVPKDSRGPRCISTEPLELMYLQQGLGRKIMAHLEGNFPTKGHVNFTYQSVNKLLALESSVSGEYATLDLKDASDLVSLKLVARVFQNCPELQQALLALRSTHTVFPDGTRIELYKYAPMGSALCFPVESVIFWALAVLGSVPLQDVEDFVRFTSMDEYRLPNSFATASRSVFVYGDDIIIRTVNADSVIDTLEHFDLKVNQDKSCRSGSFRESCGTDAFDGVNVTPLRLRTMWSGLRRDAAALYAFTSLANSISERLYSRTEVYLWQKLDAVYGRIPYGTKQSGFPCYELPEPAVAEELNTLCCKRRWNRNYQRQEFYLLSLKTKRRRVELDGWPRLLRNLTSGGGEDPSHMMESRSAQLRRSWKRV